MNKRKDDIAKARKRQFIYHCLSAIAIVVFMENIEVIKALL